MFGSIKKMFIGLLNTIVSTSNHAKCILLSNQICVIQPTRFIRVYDEAIYLELFGSK